MVPFVILAQSPSERGLGLGMSYGNIVKHTEKLYHATTQPSYNIELNYVAATSGDKFWHRRFGYPVYGYTATYIDSRDSIIGKIVSIMPHISFRLWRQPKFDGFIRLGTGPALASKHWSRLPLSDSFNNYIGGTFNMYASVMGYATYRVNKNFLLQGGYTLSHTSNVGLVKPNLGVNLFGGYLGAVYVLPSQKETAIDKENPQKNQNAVKPNDNKWGIRTRFSYGLNEYGKADGPIRPIYSGLAAATYSKGQKHKFHAGLLSEYNTNTLLFLQATNQPIKNKKWTSTNFYASIGDEFQLGKFSLPLEINFYLNSPPYSHGPFTQRFGVLYYPYFGKKNSYKSPYCGLMMKSEMITADFIEVVGGIHF